MKDALKERSESGKNGREGAREKPEGWQNARLDACTQNGGEDNKTRCYEITGRLNEME